jgi:hypothetical protein
MRRLLAAAFAATVVAGAAACGNDDPEPAADNTEEVCAQAEMVQLEQAQQLDQNLTALQERDLEPEEFEQEAVTVAEEALVGWSDGLAEQADVATDPQLSQALTDLSDGLAEAAPQLTFENLETGQIPGAEDLDAIGQTLTEICGPPTPPGTPGGPGGPATP